MDLDGWHPDPFGIHQTRLFTQGEPTAVVKDNGIGSLDAPPVTPRHAGEGASATARHHVDGSPAGMMSVASVLVPPTASCSDLAVDRHRHHHSAGSSANQGDPVGTVSQRDLNPSIGRLVEVRRAIKYRAKTVQTIALILTTVGVLVAVLAIVGETNRSVLTATKLSPPVRELSPPTTLTPLERAFRALPRSTAPATSSSQSSNALSTTSPTPVTQLSPTSFPRGSTESVVPTTTSGTTTRTNAPTPTSLTPPQTPTPPTTATSRSSPPTTPPLPRERATAAPAVGQRTTAQVAAGLIHAVNQQSNGTEHIPVTADNVSLLDRWMANEGGFWADNPLNTSLDSAAYPHQFTTSGEDTGIPIFPSITAGIGATATTLLSNQAYAQILQVLKSGKTSCLNFATAVIHSPWASSHYGYDTARFCSGTIVPPVRRGHGHPHLVHRRHHAAKAKRVTRVNGRHGKGHKR